MNKDQREPVRLLRAIRREPLVLFLVFGLALAGLWAMATPDDIEMVRVEDAALRALERSRVELLGRALTDDERTELREGFIDDEVLLREALRRGLQYSDFRVRKRLVQIMRGALTENVADPSPAQLEAFFRDEIDRFSRSESTTLEQVFFPWGEEVSDKWLDETLAELRNGANPDAIGAESMTISRLQKKLTRTDLVTRFGAAFADGVEGMTEGEWVGPLESVRGVHLVRVLERHPPETATFEQAESYLRQEWLMARMRELQQKGIDEIRAGYRVEIVEE
jgi:PPIC-type PPIASE domain